MKKQTGLFLLVSVISTQIFAGYLLDYKNENLDDIMSLKGKKLIANVDQKPNTNDSKWLVNEGLYCSLDSNVTISHDGRTEEQYWSEITKYNETSLILKNSVYLVNSVRANYYRTDISIDLVEMFNPAPDYSDMQPRAEVEMTLQDSKNTEIVIKCTGSGHDFGKRIDATSKVKNAFNYLFRN